MGPPNDIPDERSARSAVRSTWLLGGSTASGVLWWMDSEQRPTRADDLRQVALVDVEPENVLLRELVGGDRDARGDVAQPVNSPEHDVQVWFHRIERGFASLTAVQLFAFGGKPRQL